MFEFKVSLTETEDGFTESKFEIVVPQDTPTEKEVNDALVMLAVISVSSTLNNFFNKRQESEIYTEAKKIGDELMTQDFGIYTEEIDVITYPKSKGGIH